MRLITLSTILTLLLIGCGDAGSSGIAGSGGTAGTGGDRAGTGGSGGTDRFNATLSHTYDPIDVALGEEVTNICQTWVLGNEDPLYVRKVRQTNEGGWHHSNWFFVPEGAYPPNYEAEGPDATLGGTWNCRDRGFREFLAAAAGGVFFAQSTQTLTELQAFPDSSALEIPPHSVIVGSVHLLNVSAQPLASAIRMEVETVPADDVAVRLTPYSFAIGDLKIPAAVDGVPTESRTAMTCDLRQPFQDFHNSEVDYNVYYVLGHYHQWGNFFNLSFVQEDGTRETIFEIKNRIGEPIGSIIDPPMNNKGAPMLRSECGFINNTDETLTRGLQYGEMCDFLAYTDANLAIGAGGGPNDDIPDDFIDGPGGSVMEVHELDCGPITAFKPYAE
jgi:hypothetical protein